MIRRLILLVLLTVTPLCVARAAEQGTNRMQAFENIALAEGQRGDLSAQSWLRALGQGAPMLPPELSEQSRWWQADYAAKYDVLRQRVIQALLYPEHGPENQWRVDVAEASLHLVAYELEQGRRASVPLIQKFLLEAWTALDHHISIENRIAIEAAPLSGVPGARIEAAPAAIRRGECAVVAWQTWNATEAWLNGQSVALAGSMEVCPSATESYNLEAVGSGGKALAWATVAVVEGPMVASPGTKKYRIHFDFNESVIRRDALDTMAAVSNMMRDNPALMMRVEGHCDAIGAVEYNMGLGMRRAQSVRDFFVTRYGISPVRFTPVSKGEREPIAPNTRTDGKDNPEGRQLNRRAEFIEIR